MGCGLGCDRLADRRAVGSCDVLLAVIGDQWLTITDQHSRRRLDHRSRRGRPTRTRVLARVGVAVALFVVVGSSWRTCARRRKAAREHKDSRKSNQGRTLAPGETIDAQEQVPLDSAGTWKLWPC